MVSCLCDFQLCLENVVFFEAMCHLCCYNLSVFSSTFNSEPGWEECDADIPLGLSTPKSLTPYTLSSCGSLDNIHYHILQEEASLVRAKQCIDDLWV